jgi:DNA-directed RNA polymerase subunit RPC12/RpoP
MSESVPPRPSTAPTTGQKLPCKACGAKLDFDPATHALKCPYCGHLEKIDAGGAAAGKVHSYDDFLAHGTGESTVSGRSQQVKCDNCGAEVLLEDKVVVSQCPYCACPLSNQPEAAQAMIAPDWLLPFAVDNRKAIAAFNAWLVALWFAPNELKKFANLGRLNGVYVPFWTFDSKTFTKYTGLRGDNYTETEYYTDTETYLEDGETKTRQVQKSRQAIKTRWTPVSGQVRRYFQDVPACASKSLPEYYTGTLTPKELHQLESFRPEYLSGFTTERYSIGPKEGFEMARAVMDVEIRRICCQDIGGDQQQLQTVHTRHDDVKFKHLLLPVWLASYRYRETSYQVLVNGQTGHVVGDRPYSWVKIVGLIAVILAVILALVLIFKGVARGESGSPQRSLAPPSEWISREQRGSAVSALPRCSRRNEGAELARPSTRFIHERPPLALDPL